MPVLPPTVPVFNLYLPAAGKNLVSQDALGEPNDICQQSYPVSINEAGQFLAEDVDDWYRFTLNSTSDLTILLIDFAPVAGQITLWRGDCQNLVLIGQNGDFATQKSVNLTNQPPGEYHIWLINDGPLNATSKYTLLATTP